MKCKTRSGHYLTLAAWLAGTAVLLQACGEDTPTSPGREIEPAGKPSSGDPTVTSTDPSGAPQDTTLDVHVFGSNFDRGSKAELALDCETGCVITEKVKTNSTRFVNEGELVANVTIAVDAVTDLYDVLVTTSKGKRGIGIEMFEITLGPTNPQTGYAKLKIGRLSGNTNCLALGVSEQSHVAGRCFYSRTGDRAFYWGGSDMIDLGQGRAIDLSDGGSPTLVGSSCPSETECYAVTWEPAISTQPTPLPTGCSNGNAIAAGITGDGLMIAGGACAAGSSTVMPAIWTRQGSAWSDPQVLPLPPGYTSGRATDISMHGVILGYVFPNGPDGSQAAVWFPPYSEAELLPQSPYAFVIVSAINDNGDVIGQETAAASLPHTALLWTRIGTSWNAPLEIEELSPHGINNYSTVVGNCGGPGCVWSASEGLVDIAGQGLDDVNDNGWLAGHDNAGNATLWVPAQ